MKYLVICVQVLLLFVFLFVGDRLQRLLHLPISGSILGMILLFLALTLKIIPEKWIARGSNFLISIISLLFVPSLAGIIKFPSFFSPLGAIFLFTIIVSTVLTMVSAGWVSQILEKIHRSEGEEGNGTTVKSLNNNSN